MRVTRVQGNVYLLAGAGGHIAAQVGDDGVLLVDTGPGALTDKVLAAVRQLSDKPIRVIVNTHAHPDRVGGNEALAKAGVRLGGGLVVAGPAGTGASIVAHENVLASVSAPTGTASPDAGGGLAHRRVPRRIQGHVRQRRGDPVAAPARRAHPTATAWCSSAAPTSS